MEAAVETSVEQVVVTPKRGRPVNPNSVRQRKLREKAEKEAKSAE
jgi:hypothetical protein